MGIYEKGEYAKHKRVNSDTFSANFFCAVQVQLNKIRDFYYKFNMYIH